MLTLSQQVLKRGRNLNKEKVGNFSVQLPVMRSHSQALINLVSEQVIMGKLDGSNNKLDAIIQHNEWRHQAVKARLDRLTADTQEIRRLLESTSWGLSSIMQTHPAAGRSDWASRDFEILSVGIPNL